MEPLDLGSDLAAERVHARHLALLLRDKTAEDRASAAAAYAMELLSVTLATHVTESVACAKGCHHCCHGFVSATIPEVLWLARLVRDDAAKTARTHSIAARTSVLPQSERSRHIIDCPMLEGGACGAYARRPLACRTMLSKSLRACEFFYVGPGGNTIPMAANAASARGRVELVFQAALILGGLAPQHYELNATLAIALTTDNAEARWLQGEPIFAAAPIDRYEGENADLSAWVQILVDAVRPTL